MDAIEVLEQNIGALLAEAHQAFAEGDNDAASNLYKVVLRQLRDYFGPCHLRIADVFEFLGRVHQVNGKVAKVRAIDRRVHVIRSVCNEGRPL